MKNSLILLISTFVFIFPAKADTIDHWLVYYNKLKLKEFTEFSKSELILKIKDIKKTDSLIIHVFRCIACVDCNSQISIENGKHQLITSAKGNRTTKPVSISVFDLLQYHLKGKDVYDVFYQEGQIKNSTERLLLFKIKLE